MKINIGDTVKVKLTEIGESILAEDLDRRFYNGGWPSEYPKDKDGYQYFMLGDFASIFGNYIYDNTQIVTENNDLILLEENNNEDH